MASQNGHLASLPAAHVIGKAFVEQYYNILRLSPEMVHKFYQDVSLLGRPDLDGTMSSVTTMQGINEKIMSLKYGEYNFEIETVDAQHSFKEGVIVLVTGCLTGKANIQKKFTQFFFLAPQDNGGYFVLNDVFRYVSKSQAKEDNNMAENATHDFATNTRASPDPVSTIPSSEDIENAEVNQLENLGSVVEEDLGDILAQPSEQDVSPVYEVTTTVQEDGPKKSYASIVKVMKGSTPAVYVPTTKAKVAPIKTEKQVRVAAPVPTVESESPSKNDLQQETSNSQEEEGHAVYARNLPLNATPAQVEEEFKKFGTIKPGGVQVRNHRQYGYCFGFVEFESESSMQAAIEASPFEISGQRVIVEVKRTVTRVGDGGASSPAGGRGQFSQGPRGGSGNGGGFRGGNRFRNDSFRARGSYTGGAQGYTRMEFRTRATSPSHGGGRGPATARSSGSALRPAGMISQTAVPA